MTINERIKIVKKALSLNQTDFGVPLGLKQGGVGNVETGRNSVTDRIIMLVCKSYNVDETWLREGGDDVNMFSDFDETGVSTFASEYDLDSLSRTILATYVGMHHKKREGINMFLRDISKEIMKDDIDTAHSGIMEMIGNISNFQGDDLEGSKSKLGTQTEAIFSELRSTSSIDVLANEPEEMIASKERSSASSGQKKKQA